MRKLVPILACLMLVLTMWAGMEHAAEARGVEANQLDMSVHAAGDGDEVPADADKGYPHHHASCHEHHVNSPNAHTTAIPIVAAVTMPPFVRTRALSGHETEAALRPPQA